MLGAWTHGCERLYWCRAQCGARRRLLSRAVVHRSGTAAKVGMGRWQELGVDGVERLLAHDCVFGRQYGACIGYQLRALITRLNIVQQPWRRSEQDD